MTIASFYRAQAKLTQAQAERVVREQVLPAYREALRETDSKLKALVIKLTDEKVKPEDYYNNALKFGRYRALIETTEKAYNTAARRAGLALRASSEASFANSFYLRQFAYNFIIPDGLQSRFILPQALIDLAVLGTPEVWENLKTADRARIVAQYGAVENYIPQYGTLQSVLLADNTRQLNAIKNAITQGFIQGRGYTFMAKNIRTAFNTTASNALRIARTEGNRLANAGNFAISNAAKGSGVDIVRQWDATLDGSTREDHARLDGRKENDQGYFVIDGMQAKYPSHFGVARMDINCRCSVIDVVAGRTPEVRTGRNPVTGENETYSFKDFDAWAKDNDLAYHKGILRPTSDIARLTAVNNSIKARVPGWQTVNYKSRKDVEAYISGITGASDVKLNFDEDMLRPITQAVDEFATSFPIVMGRMSRVRTSRASTFYGEVLTTSNNRTKTINQTLSLSNNLMGNANQYNKNISRDISRKFHPVSSIDPRATVFHEMAHVLEGRLTEAVVNRGEISTTFIQTFGRAWDGGIVSEIIIRRSFERLGLTNAKDITSSISGLGRYSLLQKTAGSKNKEVFAEALSDAMVNDNPLPFSVVMKEETEKYIKEVGL